VSPARAQDPEAGGAAFLLVPVGGRSTALGQAAVADAGSSEAAFWNPAGLALLPASEVGIHFARTFASNNTALSGYLQGGRLGVVGVSAYLVDFGAQEVALGPGLPVGRLSPKNIELVASYAAVLPAGLSAGISYKLIQFRQDCSGACGGFPTVVGTTHGADVGIQFAPAVLEGLRLGLAVQHIGFKLQLRNRDQADPLPTSVQVGAAYRLLLPEIASVPERLSARALVDLRNAWGRYTAPDVRIGLEFSYGDLAHIRTGYAFLRGETSGPAVGVGFRLGRVFLDLGRTFFVSSNFDEPVYVSLRASI
jgi:hypothetical protein